MATTITDAVTLEPGIADAIVTALGANCQLEFYNSGDTEIATCATGTATKNTATSPDSVDIASLSNDTADAGTCTYAVLATSGGTEIIRFDDPVNDIGLTSAVFSAGQTISVTSLSVTVPA